MTEIHEGWTAPLVFQCKLDTQPGVTTPQPADLTGMPLSVVAYNNRNIEVSSPGTIVALDEDTGIVEFTPGANKFVRSGSPYAFRVLAQTASGEVSFPSGVAEYIIVRL